MSPTCRYISSVVLMLLTTGSLASQTVDSVVIEKLGQYYQGSTSAPTFDDYHFNVEVSSLAGNDLSSITTPVVGLATGSTMPVVDASTHNNGNLSFNSGKWSYGGASGRGVNTSSVSALNTLFANGPTSVTAQGNTYTLDTDGAANDQAFFPSVVPSLTMSGGSWVAGYYVIDVSQPLTVTTSNWSGFNSDGLGGFMGIRVDGVGKSGVFSRLSPELYAGDIDEGATSATFTIAANTLTAGQYYDGFAVFARVVSQDTSQSDVFAVAWWGNETRL